MKIYDFLFITNCPSFYKVNLYNELSKHSAVCVLFLGITDQVIITENLDDIACFDYYFITTEHVDSRSKISTLYRLSKHVFKLKFRYIVYSGWDSIELILLSLFTTYNKNCLVSESSIYESKLSGLIGGIKRLIFNRFAYAFVSGKPHADLLIKAGYKGSISITGGVGIFPKRKYIKNNSKPVRLSYIYTGRLIEKKNLRLLVDVFNKNGKHLTIIGSGPLEVYLRSVALSNIHFLGFIDNDNLVNIYKQHDCLILPSIIEPWGLVVEEAIQMGLTVIVSNNVGSNFDLVECQKSGVIFESSSSHSLINAINEMEVNYEFYHSNVLKVDYNFRDSNQVNAYLDILK